MISAIQKRHGRLDIVINNAGIASMNHILLTPIATINRIMATNFLGTTLVSRESAKLMQRSRYGRIVNFSTVAVPLRLQGEAIYAASKAAVKSITRIMARELGDLGITVNAVGPTPVETDLIKAVPPDKIKNIIDGMAIKRLGTFDDVANVVEFFTRRESSYVTGTGCLPRRRVVKNAWLLERMAQWHDQTAIVWRDKPCSYLDLVERTTSWIATLRDYGVGAGSVVALEGDYSPNGCALLLALFELHAIAVPLTRTVRGHRDEFLETAEAQLLFELDDNDQWTVDRLRPAEARNTLTRELIESGNPGLVVFSSGSTGKHKAILHDVDALLEKFRVQRHRRCTLTFLLLDHLGGINTLLYTLSNGGTVVSVPSRNPDVICRAIQNHCVETLPTSPTFINLLLMAKIYRSYDLSSLRLITYGTEAMPQSTLPAVTRNLSERRIAPDLRFE